MIYDLVAERIVVGVCLNTRHGVGRVALTPADFYRPLHARLFAACLAMDDVTELNDRVAFAVAFSDASEIDVRALIAESPVMFDASPWAARVAACAARRAAMQRCVQTYEALRDGTDVDEAMAWS